MPVKIKMGNASDLMRKTDVMTMNEMQRHMVLAQKHLEQWERGMFERFGDAGLDKIGEAADLLKEAAEPFLDDKHLDEIDGWPGFAQRAHGPSASRPEARK